jgi:hypothetical protein
MAQAERALEFAAKLAAASQTLFSQPGLDSRRAGMHGMTAAAIDRER